MIPILLNGRAVAPCLVLRQACHFPSSTRRLSTGPRPLPLIATTTRVNLPPLPQTNLSSRASISSSPKGHAAEVQESRQHPEYLDSTSFKYRLQRAQPPGYPYLSSDPVLGTNIQDLPPALRLWKPWVSQIKARWPDGRLKEPTEVVAFIVHAVQAHDTAEAISLIRLLVYLSHFQDVLPALQGLPRTTVSSLFRLVDPDQAGDRIDYIHSLRMDAQIEEFSPAARSMDAFGIRHSYKHLLDILESFAGLVVSVHGSLLPTEYEVLLRCAGATSDVQAVKRIWNRMRTPGDEGGTAFRTGRNYEAFIRSRYLTEDLYAQNDLKRTMFRPRNVRGPLKLDRRTRRRLDRHRIYLAYANRSKYGFSPTEPTKTLTWTTSGRLPLGRITKTILKRGIMPDERLLSAIMRAKGRSGQAKGVFRTLARHYGFMALKTDDHRDPALSFKIDHHTPLPAIASTGYLESVVKTLGTLGHPIMARRFLDFVQTEHNIQVPRAAWSIVLKYTDLAQSVRREWEIFARTKKNNQVVHPSDVLVVWNRMAALRFMDKPLFEERDAYVKALILTRDFDKALHEMRIGFEEYREATRKVQHALTAVLYPAPPAIVNAEFLRAKSVQHSMWISIAQWCRMYLWRYTTHIRTTSATTVEITNLVAEFSEFTDGLIKYRTLSGMVKLADKTARIRQQWKWRDIASPPIEVLEADHRRPALHSDGTPITYKDTEGQMMYYSHKRLLSKRIEGRILGRRKRMWERIGLEVCIRRRENLAPVFNKKQMARAIEW